MIGAAHLVNYIRSKRFEKAREHIAIEEMLKKHFAEMDYLALFEIWLHLSQIVGVSPDKLRPDDTIRGLIKGRHLPELYFENLEVYLRDNGVSPADIHIELTVKELVERLVRQRKASPSTCA